MLDGKQFNDFSCFASVEVNIAKGVQEEVLDSVNENEDSETDIREFEDSEVDIHDLESDYEEEDLDKDKILDMAYILLKTIKLKIGMHF